MKSLIYILTAVIFVCVGCKKEEPVTPPTTKSMTSTELDLVGEWSYDSLQYLNTSGAVILTELPTCSGPTIIMQSDLYAGGNSLDVYQHTDNKWCNNISAGWSAASSSEAYLNNTLYEIILLSTTNLVLKPDSYDQRVYYTRL
jgi:hypothetical protein